MCHGAKIFDYPTLGNYVEGESNVWRESSLSEYQADPRGNAGGPIKPGFWLCKNNTFSPIGCVTAFIECTRSNLQNILVRPSTADQLPTFHHPAQRGHARQTSADDGVLLPAALSLALYFCADRCQWDGAGRHGSEVEVPWRVGTPAECLPAGRSGRWCRH